jgi:uncharacterized Fe-S cluster-containing MiaB family protein
MGGAEGVGAREGERTGAGERSRRIRALRPPKPEVDPAKPLGWVEEPERRPDGTTAPALTVFLAGAECPFTCVFCDLWRSTLDGRTPAGALPAQLRQALEEWTSGGGAEPVGNGEPPRARIKLYNASNFFDPRAVPPEDLPELARLAEPFPHVTVENHPRLTDERCRDFQRLLTGRLEVALGLETIHPQALPRLEKRISVDDFDQAADRLRSWDLDLRVFVLVGTPFVPPTESLEWTVATVEHALDRGARLVALNPVRGGNGEMERLAATGEFTPPTLGDLEDALDACLDLPRAREAVVVADLWDVELLATCPGCSEARIERLRRLNLTGRPEPRVECGVCT